MRIPLKLQFISRAALCECERNEREEQKKGVRRDRGRTKPSRCDKSRFLVFSTNCVPCKEQKPRAPPPPRHRLPPRPVVLVVIVCTLASSLLCDPISSVISYLNALNSLSSARISRKVLLLTHMSCLHQRSMVRHCERVRT